MSADLIAPNRIERRNRDAERRYDAKRVRPSWWKAYQAAWRLRAVQAALRAGLPDPRVAPIERHLAKKRAAEAAMHASASHQRQGKQAMAGDESAAHDFGFSTDDEDEQ